MGAQLRGKRLKDVLKDDRYIPSEQEVEEENVVNNLPTPPSSCITLDFVDILTSDTPSIVEPRANKDRVLTKGISLKPRKKNKYSILMNFKNKISQRSVQSGFIENEEFVNKA